MKKIIGCTLMIISLLLIGCSKNNNNSTKINDNTHFVNPFIGTGGHGHTFPGATIPNGMIQLSPDTRTDLPVRLFSVNSMTPLFKRVKELPVSRNA